MFGQLPSKLLDLPHSPLQLQALLLLRFGVSATGGTFLSSQRVINNRLYQLELVFFLASLAIFYHQVLCLASVASF
jgi:hypothetical protein